MSNLQIVVVICLTVIAISSFLLFASEKYDPTITVDFYLIVPKEMPSLYFVTAGCCKKKCFKEYSGAKFYYNQYDIIYLPYHSVEVKLSESKKIIENISGEVYIAIDKKLKGE